MNVRLKTLTAAALLALAACAGTNFQADQVARIHNGMTEDEVVAILGKPYSRAQVNGETAVLTWSYAVAFGGAKAVSYRFSQGRVVGSTSFGQ